MEIAVIENHAALLAGGATPHSQIIVENEAKLRIPNEITLHLNDSIDSCIDDNTVRIEKDLTTESAKTEKVTTYSRTNDLTYGELLEDVDKDFV